MTLSKLVDKDTKMNRKPIGLKMIDIDDIKENELNTYSQEGIDVLADNIKMYGLMKPLEVYEVDDYFKLLGGHRRLKALKLLFENGEIDAEIPCLLYHDPITEDMSDVEERMKIIMSNAQRDLTDKDKILVTQELLGILQDDPSKKPLGMTTREWIAPFLGCSARTSQKYINLALGKEEKKSSSSQKEQSQKNHVDRLNKMIKKYNKEINNIFWEFTDEERQTVLSKTESGEEITIDKIINKLAGITMLITNSFDELEKTRK